MKQTSVVLGGLLLLVVVGCHGRRGGGMEETAPSTAIWETTWVDPQLVMTERMFTLIRSARLDSFVVKRPTPVGVGSQSLVWQVSERNCTATVNLLDSRGTVVRPLLVRQLEPGHYKLTMDFSRIDYEELPSGEYSLRVDNCGETRSAKVVRR